jgi:hypothetical protein
MCPIWSGFEGKKALRKRAPAVRRNRVLSPDRHMRASPPVFKRPWIRPFPRFSTQARESP